MSIVETRRRVKIFLKLEHLFALIGVLCAVKIEFGQPAPWGSEGGHVPE